LGNGNPHYRAALDSGMTITESHAMVLAGKQPDQKRTCIKAEVGISALNAALFP
jgi:hypothetical protein